MSLWLVRAGSYGEFEKRFLEESRIYLTWEALQHDLSPLRTKGDLNALLTKVYTNSKAATIRNWVGQIWSFVKEMREGDWVVLPSKLKRAAIHFSEVTGPYTFDLKADGRFCHYRTVKWIVTDVPRSNFEQDLLYSFGAFKTVCQIERNDAEARIHRMSKEGWKARASIMKGAATDKPESDTDLELLARAKIAKTIIQKFKGHGLARLVDAILRAQGYATYLSPGGPDRGIDILASPGPLGFGNPRICVQVKSGDMPVDSPTLSQLVGSMQTVQADQGLLVSWGGFKSSIDREIPAQFFRVRLWDQDDLVDALLDNYERLDEDLQADIPLKRIWTVAEVESGV
jgi:restriction system protein